MKSILLAFLLAFCGTPVLGADESDSPDTDIWRKVRVSLFGERPILDDASAGRIRVEIAQRAVDSAVVPLAIHVDALPGEAPTQKLYLVIDRNPSPIAAIFELGAGSGGAYMETRVRIQEYTWIRLIAERTDGSLVATQRFIKAAGGCSAPAGKPLSERLASIGQMKWRFEPMGDSSAAIAELMVRHPNSSGLAMDQLTRLYEPAYYVRSVRVTQDNELVFSADVDFSISENPVFRFHLKQAGGVLRAVVTDSKELTFESSSAGLY